jgi:hypothetical protein
VTLSSIDRRHQKSESLFDIHPVTGARIEVFYADRTLETFGRTGAGWFRSPRRRGFAPEGPAIGPLPTSYSAYRHAILGDDLGSNLGTDRLVRQNTSTKTGGYHVFVAEGEELESNLLHVGQRAGK